jgi:hypothetical protein
MKGWLNKTTLALMVLALTRKEPFAQEPFCPLERSAFHKVSLVGHKHIFDVVGVTEQAHVLRPELDMRNIAVLASQLR